MSTTTTDKVAALRATADTLQEIDVESAASLRYRAQALEDQRIQEYLDDYTPTYDATIGSIDTCVRIIGCYDPGDSRRDQALCQQALDSILEWAADYGVTP